MKDEKKKTMENIERYLFLLKSLKEDKMEETIEEKYLKYMDLAKKENSNDKELRR